MQIKFEGQSYTELVSHQVLVECPPHAKRKKGKREKGLDDRTLFVSVLRNLVETWASFPFFRIDCCLALLLISMYAKSSPNSDN